MQACIITAYHNFNQLNRLIEILSKKFEVYVHIDKKTKPSWKEILKEKERVHLYSKFNINCGGSAHLKAIVWLMNEALSNENISYFHIISGDDWPVRSLEEIYSFFEDSNEISLLTTKMSDMTDEWYKTSARWQKYYSFLDIFNYKDLKQKIFVKSFVKFQQLIGVNRFKQLEIEMAQGLVWGGIPRNAFEYCMKYVHDNPEFWEFMTYGHASEEFFFQTILANNDIFEKQISNKNYRYMNWNKKNGSYPGILDMDDYENIINGEFFFVRKIDLDISGKLIDTISEKYAI